MRGWLAVLAVMWVGLAACSGDDAEDRGPVKRADFNAKVTEALCERFERCGLVEDRERCQEEQAREGMASRLSMGTRYDDALAEGRVRYDAEAARDCVDSLREGSCEASPTSLSMLSRGIEYDPQCRILLGQVEDGAACQSTVECREGAWCDALPWACGGVCRREPLPEAVIANDGCPWGTVLIGGKCLTPGGVGTRCGAENNVALGVCDQTTWCGPTNQTHGTCQPRATEGQACSDIEGPFCVWSQYCGASGTCQKARGEGESCTAPGLSRFGYQECQLELFCDGDENQPGTCRRRLGEGASCRETFECESDLGCASAQPNEGVKGTCQRAPTKGESCPDGFCAPGMLCSYDTKTCVTLSRLGEPCEVDDNCYLSGSCVDGICRIYGSQSCQ
ncbi:hypothetical protein HPC49_18810 [Pyxidicoccus fallax]|uniref:Dickkopf N-terminal cysteine-rich domain-containing protein n=1 Tax=Pyxidicoccus fallax TaxID=394095 RepID=A0A848LQ20_9BACT|nr:hypothetical protein [Pyxidicoccus fallax]NMO19740.1 hypothetical protein [Pyxidicoccus fallax]NPC80263.1 hypothetical protein [Pyxidicoccus fallax]